eukprot:m.343142 g.343142  ORF g.343142 m.343142 type:complete len:256 (-) comp22418_c0_seq1:47-814(-)
MAAKVKEDMAKLNMNKLKNQEDGTAGVPSTESRVLRKDKVTGKAKEDAKKAEEVKESLETEVPPPPPPSQQQPPQQQQLQPTSTSQRIKGYVTRVRATDGFSETFNVKKRAQEEGVNPETIRSRARKRVSLDGWTWCVTPGADADEKKKANQLIFVKGTNEEEMNGSSPDGANDSEVTRLRKERERLRRALNTTSIEKKQLEDRNSRLETELNKYKLKEERHLKDRAWKAKNGLENAMSILSKAVNFLPKNEQDT